MDLSNSQSLLYYKTQINTTIPQTNIISTIKQLINAVSQFLQICRNIRIKFLSWGMGRERETETDRQTDRH